MSIIYDKKVCLKNRITQLCSLDLKKSFITRAPGTFSLNQVETQKGVNCLPSQTLPFSQTLERIDCFNNVLFTINCDNYYYLFTINCDNNYIKVKRGKKVS
jgi:hypothetical protein